MKKSYIYLAIALFLFAGACKEDPTTPETASTEDVSNYLESLPSWEQFSPPGEAKDPTPVDGSLQDLGYDTLDVDMIDDDGTIIPIENVVYHCQSERYTVQDNPAKIVMYNPDTDVLWPGALIQGKSYRDGIGSLQGLIIDERSPIEVSIDLAVPTGGNLRIVDTPTQGEVALAISEIISNAVSDNVVGSSDIHYDYSAYHSESQFALQTRISGRHLGFEAMASGDLQRNASETTVTAYFYQTMYTVTVAPPSTPGGWFNSDFTQEKLDEQIALGRIGPDNLPVYISSIVYGRMLMYSLTSTASAEDIEAALEASKSNLVNDVTVELSAKHKKILETSKIAIATIGGNDSDILATIRSGDLSRYFTNSPPLSSAAPLIFTFKNIGDNSTALVTEATEYNVTSCTATTATQGTFDLKDVPGHTLKIPAPVTTLVGDIDGDGNDDLIWNHLSSAGNVNQLYVGLHDGNGNFSYTNAVEHAEKPGAGWGTYHPIIADIDGDGKDDLVWNHLSGQIPISLNITYVGISNGDGTFDWYEGQVFPFNQFDTPSWGTGEYKLLRADLNNDNVDDLVWNSVLGHNKSYAAISNGDGTYQWSNPHNRGDGWSPYDVFIGDVDADGRDDLIWNHLSSQFNRIYVSTSNGNGTFTKLSPSTNNVNGWNPYKNHVGDINGDGMVDLIFDKPSSTDGKHVIHRALSDGNSFDFQSRQTVDGLTFNSEPLDHDSYVADVNADGRADLILNELGNANRTWVYLGQSDGSFSTTRLPQTHSSNGEDWGQFDVYILASQSDSTNFRNHNIVWNHAAGENKIYVGVAR